MPRRDSRASGGFLAVPCPYCDPALGARLLLIDRIGNPESFWLPQSYWRHLQEFHSPSCERVVAALRVLTERPWLRLEELNEAVLLMAKLMIEVVH